MCKKMYGHTDIRHSLTMVYDSTKPTMKDVASIIPQDAGLPANERYRLKVWGTMENGKKDQWIAYPLKTTQKKIFYYYLDPNFWFFYYQV